jgi:hypothetical protein
MVKKATVEIILVEESAEQTRKSKRNFKRALRKLARYSMGYRNRENDNHRKLKKGFKA